MSMRFTVFVHGMRVDVYEKSFTVDGRQVCINNGAGTIDSDVLTHVLAHVYDAGKRARSAEIRELLNIT